MATERTVAVSSIPVTVGDYGIRHNITDMINAPKTNVNFTTLDSLKSTLDEMFKDVTTPICVMFDFPKGARKPAGFDAFSKTNRYRNVTQ